MISIRLSLSLVRIIYYCLEYPANDIQENVKLKVTKGHIQFEEV